MKTQRLVTGGIGLLSKFSPALVPRPAPNRQECRDCEHGLLKQYQRVPSVQSRLGAVIPSPQLHFILIFFTPQKSFSASKTHITDSSRESSPLSDSLRQDNSSLARSESPFNYILANHSSSAGSGQVNEGQGTFTLDQNSAAMAFVPMPAYNDLLNLDQCLDVRPSHDNEFSHPQIYPHPFHARTPTWNTTANRRYGIDSSRRSKLRTQSRKSHFLLSPVTERRAVASQRSKLCTQSRKSHFLLSPVTERRAVADERGRRGAESGV